MRILYFHQYFNTPAMSGGTRSYELGRRLVTAGHEVHVITTERQRSAERVWRTTVEAGIQVHWLPVPYDNRMGMFGRLKAFFDFALRAAARATEVGGDVVFATSTPLTIAIPGVRAARSLKVPLVFEVRDLWPEVPIAMGVLRDPLSIAAARWLEHFAYRNSAEIVALSPGMKEGVTNAGFDRDRVTVIPNGCDLEMFGSGASRGAQLRAETPWLGDRPLVLYTGTLGRINGVDWLAKLAGAVAKLDPEIQFAVAGDGAMLEAIRQVAAGQGVLDQTFHILGGVPKDRVPAWLAAADVSAVLFIDLERMWANASTNKFFDAIASGTPVIFNHGGYQAIVAQEAGAGFQLPRYDLDEAARQLVALLRDHSRLEMAGAAARTLAEQRFSRDQQARDLEAVLQRAVGHHSATASTRSRS